jgi:hypothetical protein
MKYISGFCVAHQGEAEEELENESSLNSVSLR